MLESNYLSILLVPTYEKPVDTAEDILERGFSIIKGRVVHSHWPRSDQILCSDWLDHDVDDASSLMLNL